MHSISAFSQRLFVFVFLAFSSAALSDTITSLGELNTVVKPGLDNQWNIQPDSGGISLENQEDPYSIYYFYTDSESDTAGQRSISVDLAFYYSETDSLAGLLYGYKENPHQYYLFTVGGDQSANLHRMQDGQFSERLSVPLSGLDPERTTLQIQEEGNELTLSVNSTVVGNYHSELTGTGHVGIVAAGIGKFRFTNFSIQSSMQATANGFGGAIDKSAANKSATESRLQPASAQQKPVAVADTDWVMTPALDKQTGLVKYRQPMRKSWLDEPNPAEFTLNQIFSKSFGYSQDPMMRQIMQAQGLQIAPPEPLDEFVFQTFASEIKSQGYTLVRQYALPEITARMAEQDLTRYFGDVQTHLDAIGTEWQQSDGKPAFALLRQTVMYSNTGQISWNVMIQELQADEANFQKAVDDYIYSQSNVEINPEWVLQSARQTGQQLAISQAQHNALMQQSQQAHWQRMNQIQARSNSSSSIASTYSEILDINHSGYLDRSNLTSAGQSSTVQAIGEYQLINHPQTGETYRVDSSSKYFWLTNDGQYIGTDNANFDPRTHPGTNQQQWSKFSIFGQ